MKTYRFAGAGDSAGIAFTDGAETGWITRDGAGWDEYQAKLADGNTPASDPEMTPEKVTARAAERQAATDRRADIIAKLSGLTDAQIDAYINANVTNLSGAVAFLKQLTKVTKALAVEAGVK
jgi:hypothetical protein